MKYTLRLPTKEYSYIEIEAEGTVEEAVHAFTELDQAYNSDKEGLNVQEWAKVRDHYVETGVIDIEDFEKLSKSQSWFIGQLKKAKKDK